MSKWILIIIALAGLVLNVFLMYRKTKEIRAMSMTEFGVSGEELWQSQKKHWVVNFIFAGIIANFFDTLGIGSFAPTATYFKIFKSCDDELVPGTLNVGDTVPVCVEAAAFFGLVNMDVLTLVTMIVASIAGAYLSAGIVSRFDRKKVRYSLFVGLLILSIIMFAKWAGIGPFSLAGSEMGLRGIKLIIAIVVNFILGGLMSIGVGLYAPCMALCVILGLDASCAFPAMMGSCAYLMAFGNGPKFIKEGRFDMFACWMMAAGGGLIGVPIAAWIVGSLPIYWLTLMVVIVCFLTSLLYLRDAIKKGSAV
ncbi:MAG: sulfite exporter TauE/SafE family protein [Mogibacterium sp.]|nr:sulfite exporter TauE/SafE family protein [Mogibacterium sp.]